MTNLVPSGSPEPTNRAHGALAAARAHKRTAGEAFQARTGVPDDDVIEGQFREVRPAVALGHDAVDDSGQVRQRYLLDFGPFAQFERHIVQGLHGIDGHSRQTSQRFINLAREALHEAFMVHPGCAHETQDGVALRIECLSTFSSLMAQRSAELFGEAERAGATGSEHYSQLVANEVRRECERLRNILAFAHNPPMGALLVGTLALGVQEAFGGFRKSRTPGALTGVLRDSRNAQINSRLAELDALTSELVNNASDAAWVRSSARPADIVQRADKALDDVQDLMKGAWGQADGHNFSEQLGSIKKRLKTAAQSCDDHEFAASLGRLAARFGEIIQKIVQAIGLGPSEGRSARRAAPR